MGPPSSARKTKSSSPSRDSDPQPHAINLILHLVQFSTNLAHPEAREPMLLAHSYSPSPHWHAPQVSIELVGEFLVLGIANMTEGPQQEDKFVVYAWRTGECKMVRVVVMLCALALNRGSKSSFPHPRAASTGRLSLFPLRSLLSSTFSPEHWTTFH